MLLKSAMDSGVRRGVVMGLVGETPNREAMEAGSLAISRAFLAACAAGFCEAWVPQ